MKISVEIDFDKCPIPLSLTDLYASAIMLQAAAKATNKPDIVNKWQKNRESMEAWWSGDFSNKGADYGLADALNDFALNVNDDCLDKTRPRTLFFDLDDSNTACYCSVENVSMHQLTKFIAESWQMLEQLHDKWTMNFYREGDRYVIKIVEKQNAEETK